MRRPSVFCVYIVQRSGTSLRQKQGKSQELILKMMASSGRFENTIKMMHAKFFNISITNNNRCFPRQCLPRFLYLFQTLTVDLQIFYQERVIYEAFNFPLQRTNDSRNSYLYTPCSNMPCHYSLVICTIILLFLLSLPKFLMLFFGGYFQTFLYAFLQNFLSKPVVSISAIFFNFSQDVV